MAERSVSVRLSANISGYVAAMNAAKAATNGFSTESQASLRRLGSAMQGFGRAATLAVSVPLTALGVASTKMAMDFQNSFTRMVGLAEVPASEVDRLQEAVKGLSGETGRAPAELAAGLYQAASSGMDAAAALEATTLAARASALGMGQAKDSTGLIAAATNAYGKENITAAQTMDILTMAIREGKAEPDEMAHALGRVIPIAAQMDIGFDEVAGSVAYLSNIMGDTDQTVTGFRDALVKLNNPTVQGRATLKAMGTSFEELQASLDEGGLLGALELLRTHGFDENSEALQRLFADVQGFNAASALLADNSGTLATTLGKTADAAGAFDEAWQTWVGTDAAKVSQAFGKIKVAMVEVGEVLLPIVADVADVIGTLASAFGELPGPVQAAAVAFGALAITAGPFILFAGTIIKNIALIKAAIAGLQAITLPTWLSGLSGMGARAGAGAVSGPIGALLALNVAGAGAHNASLDAVEAGTVEDRRRNSWAGRAADTVLQRNVSGSIGSDVQKPVPSRGLADLMSGGTPLNTEIPESIAALPSLFDEAWRTNRGLNSSLMDSVRFLRDAGESATVFEGHVLRGAEAEARMANANARVSAEQDFYNMKANEGIRIAAEQYAQFQRNQEAAEAYRDVLASDEWGAAPLEAAGTALGNFNAMLFNGYSQIATTESAMDGLAEALKEVGTVGADGMADLNLKTEEGRRAFAALQEVAGAFEPQLAEAVSAAGGSVDTLAGTLGGLRDSFIETAVAAGIPRAEAENLATAIGLIPENATTLIELQGDEEARIRLGLMQSAINLLDEKDQVEIGLLIADGQFSAAAALAQQKLGALDATNATPTITAIDNASGTIASVRGGLAGLRDRTITITTRHVTTRITVDAQGSQTGGRIYDAEGHLKGILAAEGGYFDKPTIGMWAEAGAEAILPLTDPTRMRALLSDPRISGPMFAALQTPSHSASSASGAGMASSATSLTWNQNAPIYGVDDLRHTINDVLGARDARVRAGSRL
jgi:TP901 family phage tail tape measure protein